MSYCIDYKYIDYDNINISEKQEVTQSYINKYELNNIYYKYSDNVFKELKFITDFIDVSYNSNIKKFIVSNNIILDIEEKLQNLINNKYNINNNYQKIYTKLHITKTSKIILYPLKKYNIDKVIIENIDENNINNENNLDNIKKYFPYIDRNNNNIQARFILKPYFIDNYIKFSIDKCEIKYAMKKIKSELKINNIYENKLNINL